MEQDTVRSCELTVRRLLEIVRAAPGGGIHREDLERAFARGWAQIWPTARGLYGRGLIGFCGTYLVAVPRPQSSAPIALARSADEGKALARPTRDAVHPVLVPQLADARRRSAPSTRA